MLPPFEKPDSPCLLQAAWLLPAQPLPSATTGNLSFLTCLTQRLGHLQVLHLLPSLHLHFSLCPKIVSASSPSFSCSTPCPFFTSPLVLASQPRGQLAWSFPPYAVTGVMCSIHELLRYCTVLSLPHGGHICGSLRNTNQALPSPADPQTTASVHASVIALCSNRDWRNVSLTTKSMSPWLVQTIFFWLIMVLI